MIIPITLKWGKSTYSNDELSIQPGAPAHDFKLRVQTLTGVPVQRQKLLCPKAWKGPLKDDSSMPSNIAVPRGKRSVVVTLIGSADALVEKPPEERPRFEEDMTPEEIWKATRTETADQEGEEDFVDIPALQKEAGMDRDDGKMEMYEYNRLVTGLPQHQINDMLVRRMNQGGGGRSGKDAPKPQSTMPLAGEVAMTMGMELRRAYVNSLAVLSDGTIVSGLDDGHVQLWRRGQLVKDARHATTKVDHVLEFPYSSNSENDGPSFVTAGDGSICLWTKEGDKLMQFGSYFGTSPASIAVGSMREGGGAKYLATCFRVTRQADPNRFRLVPQNEAERRRREADEAQERMIQNELSRASSCINVWYYDENEGNATAHLREDVILPDTIEGTAAAPSITKLLDLSGRLICGDAWGGVRTYEWTQNLDPNNHPTITRRQCALLQFQGCNIACMEQLGKHLLAVSIEPGQESRILPLATSLRVTRPRGVYVVDTEEASIKAVLDAHSDTVQRICSLPDGEILTAGGKMDATIRVWDSLTIASTKEASKASNDGDEVKVVTKARIMKQPGYVFDLRVLSDSNGSGVYAVAAARYNLIKIVI